MQSGEESGGSSRFKTDTVNGVEMDLILVLCERAKIAKMYHFTEGACFKIGNLMESKNHICTITFK